MASFYPDMYQSDAAAPLHADLSEAIRKVDVFSTKVDSLEVSKFTSEDLMEESEEIAQSVLAGAKTIWSHFDEKQ